MIQIFINIKLKLMSYFIIQPNVYQMMETEKKTKNLLYIDMFFQNFGNALYIPTSQMVRSYYIILETKKVQSVQVFFESEIKQKNLKLQFKPLRLSKPNVQLMARSQRCIIQINAKMNSLLKQRNFGYYKLFIDKNGLLVIEITYLSQQFDNPIHAQYIMTKTLNEVANLVEDLVIEMVPYLKLEGLFNSFNYKVKSTDLSEEKELSCYDRIKYIRLLTEVYKSHRTSQTTEGSQNKSSKTSEFISSVQLLSRTNTLVQDDTKLVQKIEKQKQKYEQMLKTVSTLINPKLNEKKDHLNMYKMYLTQKEFQKYIKSVKKEHLEIYEITSIQYRIVKGVQNKMLLNSQKILSEEGVHSDIFIGTYSLHLSDTLFNYYAEVTSEQAQKKVIVKSLVCKRVKGNELESSVNSFRNQVDFLFHVKDKRSKFIATYFLPIDRSKEEVKQILAEYYEQNLAEYLQKKRMKSELGVDLLQILRIVENILLALVFLVQNSALHRDLKPSNIMVDSALKARLIDFGSCCSIMNRNQFSVKQKRMLTTPEYQLRYKQCPQQVRKKYGRQEYEQHLLYDIYSLGITLKEMMEYVKDTKSMGEREGVEVREILEMIVAKCTQPDPIDRVTFDELLYYISVLKEIVENK